MALVARAFAVRLDLEQSLAMCLDLPQTMQRLLSNQHWHSSFVSLPSLPSFDDRSDFVAGLLLDSWSFGTLLPEEWGSVGVEECTDLGCDGLSADFSADLEEEEGVGLAWWLISDLCSQ